MQVNHHKYPVNGPFSRAIIHQKVEQRYVASLVPKSSKTITCKASTIALADQRLVAGVTTQHGCQRGPSRRDQHNRLQQCDLRDDVYFDDLRNVGSSNVGHRWYQQSCGLTIEPWTIEPSHCSYTNAPTCPARMLVATGGDLLYFRSPSDFGSPINNNQK